MRAWAPAGAEAPALSTTEILTGAAGEYVIVTPGPSQSVRLLAAAVFALADDGASHEQTVEFRDGPGGDPIAPGRSRVDHREGFVLPEARRGWGQTTAGAPLVVNKSGDAAHELSVTVTFELV